MMADRIRQAFLERQLEEGLELARHSDLLDVLPLGRAPDRYVAVFRCNGLALDRTGAVVTHDRFEAGIWFPQNYLRAADPFQVLTRLSPERPWHPNIALESPLVCIGRLAPGTGLVDILYQLFEVVTWQKVTMREDDALNHAACQWARHHRDRYPVDRRPLKRRPIAIDTSSAKGAEA